MAMINGKFYPDSAMRYIESDRSDPFTRDRVLSHIDNAIGAREYDAECSTEQREYTKSDGEVVKYTVPAYINIKRL